MEILFEKDKKVLVTGGAGFIGSAFIRKILHKNGKAFGVEFDNNGEVQKVYSSNSVIVSCGAIKSPQILMLSDFYLNHFPR
mgnify:CR=1 FL=1